jgi:hypothetical protein
MPNCASFHRARSLFRPPGLAFDHGNELRAFDVLDIYMVAFEHVVQLCSSASKTLNGLCFNKAFELKSRSIRDWLDDLVLVIKRIIKAALME